MQTDEIMDRLERGELLMIDDQWRSYISMESDGMPKCFVVRSVAAHLEDAAIRRGQRSIVKCEEKRYHTLVEALLSLMDYEWHDANGKLTASQSVETARIPRVQLPKK